MDIRGTSLSAWMDFVTPFVFVKREKKNQIGMGAIVDDFVPTPLLEFSTGIVAGLCASTSLVIKVEGFGRANLVECSGTLLLLRGSLRGEDRDGHD